MSERKLYDIRQILNGVKWSSGNALAGIAIEFVSRGEPGNTGRIAGEEIVVIGAGGLETVSRTIPYHRIKRIIQNGRVIFERP